MSATPVVVKKPGMLIIKKSKVAASSAVDTAASQPDIVVGLVHKIENLEKDAALAWLVTLEDGHEQTYFEIGGVLSVIQKSEWFDPYSSFDEWVEKKRV